MASTASASRVFSAYRRLFRARKLLFQKDALALRESRSAIKQEFVKNKQAPVAELDMLLFMAEEAEDMMKHGIVQGQLNQNTGHYGRCRRNEKQYERVGFVSHPCNHTHIHADFYIKNMNHHRSTSTTRTRGRSGTPSHGTNN
jgi:hypothetical protein